MKGRSTPFGHLHCITSTIGAVVPRAELPRNIRCTRAVCGALLVRKWPMATRQLEPGYPCWYSNDRVRVPCAGGGEAGRTPRSL